MDIESIKIHLQNFRGWKIYAGFSGGADSTALLMLLNEYAEFFNINLCAVHFEHGIRGKDSIKDCEWCEEFCMLVKIPFEKVSLNVPENKKSGESIESAARRMRLEYWSQRINGNSNIAVALGHHADDAVENLFIRICRGANVSGLTSLRHSTIVNGVKFIRPLLHFNKKELVDFLISRNITDWRNDKSNKDADIVRNFFRNEVIPAIGKKLPPSSNGLLKALKVLQYDAEFIEYYADKVFQDSCKNDVTSVRFWKKLEPALVPRVLRRWINRETGSDFVPDSNWIDQFMQSMTVSRNKQRILQISPNYYFRILAGECAIIPVEKLNIWPIEDINWEWRDTPLLALPDGTRISAAVIAATSEITIKCSPDFALFDADEMPERLKVNQRHDGDKIEPFGTNRSVKLKKIIIDSKPPASLAAHIILLRYNDRIIWVPGIRRSKYYPITSATKSILIMRHYSP